MSALLEVRDLVVRFGRGRSLASLVTGRSDSITAVAGTSFAMGGGRDLRSRRGIRLRQDDLGPRLGRADAGRFRQCAVPGAIDLLDSPARR